MLTQKVRFPSFFFLQLSSVPLCKCISFFTHSSPDGHVGCFQILKIVINAVVKHKGACIISN